MTLRFDWLKQITDASLLANKKQGQNMKLVCAKNFIAVFREVISSLLSMSVMNGHGYNNKILYPK